MRSVMATLAQALARAPLGRAPSPTRPNDAEAATALADAVLGGVADGLMEGLTSYAFFGATLAAPGGDRPGFPVTGVHPGSRAERFGLRAGDRIVRVEGAGHVADAPPGGAHPPPRRRVPRSASPATARRWS
jgi:S1-C subfamily serine protease